MGEEYNLFSITRFGTLIVSQKRKENETIDLRHPEKQAESIKLRWREYHLVCLSLQLISYLFSFTILYGRICSRILMWSQWRMQTTSSECSHDHRLQKFKLLNAVEVGPTRTRWDHNPVCVYAPKFFRSYLENVFTIFLHYVIFSFNCFFIICQIFI